MEFSELTQKIWEMQDKIGKLKLLLQTEVDERARIERHLAESHNCRHPFKRCSGR